MKSMLLPVLLAVLLFPFGLPLGAVGAEKDLAAELSELKAIEAQRKETLDGLFKQLADVKGDLKERDAEIANLRKSVDDGNTLLQKKDEEIQRSQKLAADIQGSVTELEGTIASLKGKISSLEKDIADKDTKLRDERAKRQDTEEKLSRILLTDEQRKRAMDGVLEKLAAAEKLNSERGARIEELERTLADARAANEKAVAELNEETKRLQFEIARLQDDLKRVGLDRDKVASELSERKSALERDAAKVIELQDELSKVTATDAQRKKAMDKLLLEISTMEEERVSLQKDLQDARSRIEKLERQSEEVRTPKSKPVVDNSKAELDALERENEALRAKVAKLEIRVLEGDKVAADLPESAGEGDESAAMLEASQKDWEQARKDLDEEIIALRKTAEEQARTIADLQARLTESENARSDLTIEVKQLRNRKLDVRSSDLFKEMESVNVTLREKLVQIEGERQRLAKDVEKLEARDASYDKEVGREKELRQKAEKELAEVREKEVEYQELIERMMAQTPQLEQQIVDLGKTNTELKQALKESEENLRAMKIELEKREHRLIKAERVAEVLESAREDVEHAGSKEKLDMHYNMAAVYAREGKFTDAEQEYLRALQLDPTDADVHYNLGILYDDELDSPEKAVVHYRRYLKLNPHGPDADEVRSWLMKLEMDMK